MVVAWWGRGTGKRPAAGRGRAMPTEDEGTRGHGIGEGGNRKGTAGGGTVAGSDGDKGGSVGGTVAGSGGDKGKSGGGKGGSGGAAAGRGSAAEGGASVMLPMCILVQKSIETIP